VQQDIRKSAIAGSWYPGTAAALQAQIESFFARVTAPPIVGEVVGLLAPHAGYMYSGQVAALAYECVRGKRYDAVIIIGPSHRASFHGVSLYPAGGFETPLGVVPVAEELARAIAADCPIVVPIPAVHAFEHSIEIQLPFLQVALGDFRFVPLLMGDQDRSTCTELARAIGRSVGTAKVLIVGSSDLSHYHPYEVAVRLDRRALDSVAKMDAAALLTDLQRHLAEACGGGPVAVTMMAARQLGADAAIVRHYANSGDVTGDRSSVVGYGAAVFFARRTGATGSSKQEVGVEQSGELTAAERQSLLELARQTITARVMGRPEPPLPPLVGKLGEKRGAFVTLKKHGQLRGCIGYIEPIKPLAMTVRDVAIAAAFNDPRFRPVRREELNELEIEISVLSPLRQVSDLNEISVGRHGLYIVKGFYSGLLLPQVATEYGWDRLTFLEETCRKAGLPPWAWKDDDAKIFIFSAEIFSEETERIAGKNA